MQTTQTDRQTDTPTPTHTPTHHQIFTDKYVADEGHEGALRQSVARTSTLLIHSHIPPSFDVPGRPIPSANQPGQPQPSSRTTAVGTSTPTSAGHAA